jgi:hypothetical protein
MERNVKTFDIGEPIEAFQFATFLLRLARHTVELQRRFAAVKDNLCAGATTGSEDFKKFTSWSKVTQPASPKEALTSDPSTTAGDEKGE